MEHEVNAPSKPNSRHHTLAGTHMVNENGNAFLARTETVILPVTGGTPTTQFYFPDNAKLRNACIWSMETWTVNMIGKWFDQNAPVGFNLLQATFITLVTYSGEQIIYREPLVSFVKQTAAAAANYFQKGLVGQRINWPKSYLEVSDAAQLPAEGTNLNYVVGIRYTDNYDWKDKESLWLPYGGKF